MSIWSIALALFLIANPIGNTPAFVSLVRKFDFAKQKKILLRESIFSFLIAVVFLFVGEPFLHTLEIQSYALTLCGGILLFLVSLNMIFPPEESDTNNNVIPKEPYIVPIATPLITGGGVLSTIMIFAKDIQNNFKIVLACCIAWTGVTIVVVSSVYIQKILGKRGLLAMEQLMGMVLSLISMELIVKGAHLFVQQLQKTT